MFDYKYGNVWLDKHSNNMINTKKDKYVMRQTCHETYIYIYIYTCKYLSLSLYDRGPRGGAQAGELLSELAPTRGVLSRLLPAVRVGLWAEAGWGGRAWRGEAKIKGSGLGEKKGLGLNQQSKPYSVTYIYRYMYMHMYVNSMCMCIHIYIYIYIYIHTHIHMCIYIYI